MSPVLWFTCVLAVPVDKIEHYATDVPAVLPSRDTIVQCCAGAGYRQNGTHF